MNYETNGIDAPQNYNNMRIIIITQNDPFYLSKNLNVFLKRLPKKHTIVGTIVTSASPFGKKESFLTKALKTKKIFGLYFFFYYTLKFLYSKFFQKSVGSILSKNKIKKIKIQGSINSGFIHLSRTILKYLLIKNFRL